MAASAANHAAFKERLPRGKSLPQIFVDGVHIGGAEDLRIAFEREQL